MLQKKKAAQHFRSVFCHFVCQFLCCQNLKLIRVSPAVYWHNSKFQKETPTMDRNLLANATTSDDSPTPGYMLNEIARKMLCFLMLNIEQYWGRNIITGSTTNSYPANTQLQEYLLSRLAKNNHNIKYKCLVIIKVISHSLHCPFHFYKFYLCCSMCVGLVALSLREKWERTLKRWKNAYVSCYLWIDHGYD